MVIDLKFCRFESAPWGFRLIGGADYDVPITVVKVTEESLADKAGLRVGDVIVRINDEPTSGMTHNDVHDVITRAGNNFFFGVLREQEEFENQEENDEYYDEFHVRQNSQTPISIKDSIERSPVSDIVEKYYPEDISRCDVTPVDQQNVDEEIAALMSDETEIPKEQNVVGVFPKPGVCMSSEVLRTLNDEVIEIGHQKELNKHKWTTFLQKPNRPVPKSKKELEEERKRIPYKVQIVKQPKPRVAPDRPPSPPPTPVIEPEPQIQEEKPKEEPLGPVPNDSEIPNLEPGTIESDIEISTVKRESENEEETVEVSVEVSEQQVEEVQTVVETSQTFETKTEVVQKTEEELLIEKQLADVQKQLVALSTLPSTIQATLDAVTKQLSDLLPTFRLQPSPIPDENKKDRDAEAAQRDKETAEMIKICQERILLLSENKILEIPQILQKPTTTEQLEVKEKDQEHLQVQDELSYKKQKEQELITELEHKQRLIRERTPRKSSRAFGPLTPQERPLVLPGGRKWRKPKDAYNDEFIAEVLTSQAELITGHTLGVNFLKYQKPEKKIDLEKSEVYKVVHHLDRQPIRGIEVRPPKVLAEEDVRSRATPISCG